MLAWTRTAVSFAALGGVVLKANVIAGLVVLAIAPLIWRLGHATQGTAPRTRLPRLGPTRLFFITVTIVAVTVVCLVMVLLGQSAPGALSDIVGRNSG